MSVLPLLGGSVHFARVPVRWNRFVVEIMKPSEEICRTSVRPMRVDDASWAATLHRRTLKAGMFPRLGPGFMNSYYRTFVRSPHAVAIVGEMDGAPAGALVGTLRNASHYRWVLRSNGVVLALRGALGLTLRPWVAVQFARSRLGRYLRTALRHLRPRGAAAAAGDPRAGEPVAVLSHIAVEPALRGRGLGAELVDEFLDRAAAAGARQALLVTRAGPGGASGFWRRAGWEPGGTHRDADGDLVNRFRRSLAA
jgi:ribosomal protein S18 acetylase RimI-like enzyme